MSPSPVFQAGTLDSWRDCAWEASIPAGRKMRPAEFGMLLHAPELGSRSSGARRLCVLSGVEFGRPHPSPAYSFTHSLDTGLVPAAGTPDTTEPLAQKPSGAPTTHWAWHSGLPVGHSRGLHLLALLVLGLCSRSQERPSGPSPRSTLCPFSQAQFQALFQEAWHHPLAGHLSLPPDIWSGVVPMCVSLLAFHGCPLHPWSANTDLGDTQFLGQHRTLWTRRGNTGRCGQHGATEDNLVDALATWAVELTVE